MVERGGEESTREGLAISGWPDLPVQTGVGWSDAVPSAASVKYTVMFDVGVPHMSRAREMALALVVKSYKLA